MLITKYDKNNYCSLVNGLYTQNNNQRNNNGKKSFSKSNDSYLFH